MAFFKYISLCAALMLMPTLLAAQTDCPNFKKSRKGATHFSNGVRTLTKFGFDEYALITPKPFDHFPMLFMGGETAFLRHFSIGYNMGLTIKRENRNPDSELFEGLLLRPEFRYYFSKSFSGVWVGAQTSLFFQNAGFNNGLAGFQIGKSALMGRHGVKHFYISWAHSHQFQMVGVGVSWGFLWN